MCFARGGVEDLFCFPIVASQLSLFDPLLLMLPYFTEPHADFTNVLSESYAAIHAATVNDRESGSCTETNQRHQRIAQRLSFQTVFATKCGELVLKLVKLKSHGWFSTSRPAVLQGVRSKQASNQQHGFRHSHLQHPRGGRGQVGRQRFFQEETSPWHVTNSLEQRSLADDTTTYGLCAWNCTVIFFQPCQPIPPEFRGWGVLG